MVHHFLTQALKGDCVSITRFNMPAVSVSYITTATDPPPPLPLMCPMPSDGVTTYFVAFAQAFVHYSAVASKLVGLR